MKQKITAVRTILLRGFACILSTVFGISFLLNGSAFSASAAELGDVACTSKHFSCIFRAAATAAPSSRK